MIGQRCLALCLVLLAGGDALVRDALFLALALTFGIHYHPPNCYLGTGPGC